MSRHDSTIIENVKVLMLKGEKGSPGESYDDTEIRNLLRTQSATISNLEELVLDYDVSILARDMAVLESSENGKATRAYSVGDLFIYNSQLYKATTNIALEDTLTAGVNIQATTIAEKLENVDTAIEGFTNDISDIENTLEEVVEEQFNMYYGLESKTSSYTKDANGLITGIVETKSDAVATTTFTTSGSITTITTTIEPTQGEYDYTKTTVITETSSGDTITESYTRTEKEA